MLEMLTCLRRTSVAVGTGDTICMVTQCWYMFLAGVRRYFLVETQFAFGILKSRRGCL